MSSLSKVSVGLCYVLRHNPDELDLQIDRNGWVSTAQLVSNAPREWNLTHEKLQEIVDTDEKGRYQLFAGKIRCVQGHSTPLVQLDLEQRVPNQFLYHGTATRYLDSIAKNGIGRMKRSFVHLSSDINVAREVGARHGEPTIIQVRAMDMHKDGYEFYQADNGVWLTDYVPVHYLNFSG